ncbi:MAG TPA: DJ-1 family glyoxalase III, partial [Polyangiaceae bacterium]|nr:DJ-1 family glyoxalase III [Polyangiaceae bacterium]
MARALVLLAEGFEEIEAVTIIDVLRRGEVAVTTASLGGKHVKGSHEIVLEADALLSEISVDDFHALVLPGGPAAKTLREDPRAQAAIKRAAEAGKWVGAVCAGPTALETAGVLRGKRATAYPGSPLPTAQYVEEPVVEDGKVVTSRGPGTTMAFALKLVERLSSPEIAKTTAEKLLFRA